VTDCRMYQSVLPDGCHTKLLNVFQKNLDSAKNLVTSFQLKSAWL